MIDILIKNDLIAIAAGTPETAAALLVKRAAFGFPGQNMAKEAGIGDFVPSGDDISKAWGKVTSGFGDAANKVTNYANKKLVQPAVSGALSKGVNDAWTGAKNYVGSNPWAQYGLAGAGIGGLLGLGSGLLTRKRKGRALGDAFTGALMGGGLGAVGGHLFGQPSGTGLDRSGEGTVTSPDEVTAGKPTKPDPNQLPIISTALSATQAANNDSRDNLIGSTRKAVDILNKLDPTKAQPLHDAYQAYNDTMTSGAAPDVVNKAHSNLQLQLRNALPMLEGSPDAEAIFNSANSQLPAVSTRGSAWKEFSPLRSHAEAAGLGAIGAVGYNAGVPLAGKVINRMANPTNRVIGNAASNVLNQRGASKEIQKVDLFKQMLAHQTPGVTDANSPEAAAGLRRLISQRASLSGGKIPGFDVDAPGVASPRGDASSLRDVVSRDAIRPAKELADRSSLDALVDTHKTRQQGLSDELRRHAEDASLLNKKLQQAQAVHGPGLSELEQVQEARAAQLAASRAAAQRTAVELTAHKQNIPQHAPPTNANFDSAINQFNGKLPGQTSISPGKLRSELLKTDSTLADRTIGSKWKAPGGFKTQFGLFGLLPQAATGLYHWNDYWGNAPSNHQSMLQNALPGIGPAQPNRTMVPTQ